MLRLSALVWLWAMAIAAGTATAIRHLLLPPGAGADGLLASLRASWLAPAFALTFLAVLLPCAWVCWRFRFHASALAVGAAPLLAVPLLEPLFFRCPLWAALALAGLVVVARWPGPGPATWRGSGAQVVVVILTLTAALVPAWPGAQGDEIHYLLVAHSLVQDGDLNVADEYGESEYVPLHPTPLSPHYRPGLVDGTRYSMHGAGYGALLAPAYAAGSSLSPGAAVALPRLLQALLFAAFAASLWKLCAPLAGALPAGLAVGAACCLAPLLFAPLHLFPETPAMALSCLAFLLLYRPSASHRELLAGLMLACLPWLGVKYLPLAVAVACGAVLAAPSGAGAPVWRRLAVAGAPLALSLLAHGLFTQWLYGSWSPSAIYIGADPAFTRQPGYGSDWGAYLADWPGALRTFLGYFLDQREGLLAVGPHFLLAAAGLPILWRAHRRLGLALAAVLLAHLGPYALSQQLGGHSPPARPLMAVAWTLVPALALGLGATGRWLLPRAQAGLLVAGLALTVAFVVDPSLLPHDYGVTRSWLLQRLAPEGVELWRAFPSWVNLKEGAHWPATLAWLVATLAAAGLLAHDAARGDGTAAGVTRGRRHGAAAAMALTALICGWAASLVVTARHQGAEMDTGLRAWVMASVPEHAWAEPGGTWVRPEGWREVVLVAEVPLNGTQLRTRALVDARLEVGVRGRLHTFELAAGVSSVTEMELGAGNPWRGGRAWLLAARASEGATPASREGGEDHRLLGAFLHLASERPGGSR